MYNSLEKLINSYPDFPKKDILFKDIMPLFSEPEIFSKVLEDMGNNYFIKHADAIVAIDARGFLFGTGISLKLSKPLILARKPGKLPGELITGSYDLEYGTNSLSIQKNALKNYKSYAIVDDLLATGGTVNCVSDILISQNKEVAGLSVLIELKDLKARERLSFPVSSQLTF